MRGKWVYLAQRNSRLSREQFQERWLNHRNIGVMPEMVAEFIGANYCAVRPEPLLTDDKLLARLSDEYDGIGLFALNGLYSIPTIAKNLEHDYIKADERRFFTTTSNNFSMFCEEHIILNKPETESVIVQFLRRNPNTSPTEFIDAWQKEHTTEILEKSTWKKSVARYVQNVVVTPSPSGFGYAGIAEIWFDDEQNMLNAVEGVNQQMQDSKFIDNNNSFFTINDIIMCRPRSDAENKLASK